MGRNRAVALTIVLAGVVVLLAGALADVIGYGGSGVGGRQITVIVVGAVIAAAGLVGYQRYGRS